MCWREPSCQQKQSRLQKLQPPKLAMPNKPIPAFGRGGYSCSRALVEEAALNPSGSGCPFACPISVPSAQRRDPRSVGRELRKALAAGAFPHAPPGLHAPAGSRRSSAAISSRRPLAVGRGCFHSRRRPSRRSREARGRLAGREAACGQPWGAGAPGAPGEQQKGT